MPKIAMLPSPLLQVVDTFVDFLLTRTQQNQNGTDDLDAGVLTKIAINGKAFDWLKDPAEDGLYTDSDGEPV